MRFALLRFTLLRFTLLRSAPLSFAPLRSAPVMRFAPDEVRGGPPGTERSFDHPGVPHLDALPEDFEMLRVGHLAPRRCCGLPAAAAVA